MKKYNVKVVAPKAVGIWPRADVITEYKDMSYDDAMKIKEIWLNTEINVVIKESEK
jgi:hypothetical protein